MGGGACVVVWELSEADGYEDVGTKKVRLCLLYDSPSLWTLDPGTTTYIFFRECTLVLRCVTIVGTELRTQLLGTFDWFT